MTRYSFVPARPDYPAASVAYFCSAALTRSSAILRDILDQALGDLPVWARSLGFADYFGGPLMTRLARRINLIPVDADVHLLRAMRAGAAGLRAGKILNIYPEGQRALDGQLAEFRKGAAILATELNVPIIPVALDGLYRVWPRGAKLIRPAKVKIRFGVPIYLSEVIFAGKSKDEVYDALTDLVKRRIQQMLDEMRAIR